MIFWNGEEKNDNNNNVDVCGVVEGLKEKKPRMRVDVQVGRNKRRKKKCYYYNNNNGCSWWLGVMVLLGL